jgi:hypothetical protein
MACAITGSSEEGELVRWVMGVSVGRGLGRWVMGDVLEEG